MKTPQEAMTELNLSLQAEFVPFSKSRNAKKGATVHDMSLNWKVTLIKDGRNIMTTDYQAGLAHCPSYNMKGIRAGRGYNLFGERIITHECETGRVWMEHGIRGKPILPKETDVLYSLVMDADAIDYTDFEAWADNYGYDKDSRKAEKIYKACLEIGLKLRAALGEAGLSLLKQAFEGY